MPWTVKGKRGTQYGPWLFFPPFFSCGDCFSVGKDLVKSWDCFGTSCLAMTSFSSLRAKRSNLGVGILWLDQQRHRATGPPGVTNYFFSILRRSASCSFFGAGFSLSPGGLISCRFSPFSWTRCRSIQRSRAFKSNKTRPPILM